MEYELPRAAEPQSAHNQQVSPPVRATHCLAAARLAEATRPNSRPERQPLTGRGEKVSGRRSAQAAPRRSRAPGAAGRPAVDVATPSSAPLPISPNPPPASPPQSEDLAACPPARALGAACRFEERGFPACIRCASSAVGALRTAAFFLDRARARRAADALREGLERANTTLGEYGLQCFLDRRDGDKGFIAFAIVDPKSPEKVTNVHGCCCGLC